MKHTILATTGDITSHGLVYSLIFVNLFSLFASFFTKCLPIIAYTCMYRAKVTAFLLAAPALVRSLHTWAHIRWKIFTKDYIGQRIFIILSVIMIHGMAYFPCVFLYFFSQNHKISHQGACRIALFLIQ